MYIIYSFAQPQHLLGLDQPAARVVTSGVTQLTFPPERPRAGIQWHDPQVHTNTNPLTRWLLTLTNSCAMRDAHACL
jgi:hypothetical protein